MTQPGSEAYRVAQNYYPTRAGCILPRVQVYGHTKHFEKALRRN